MFLLSEDHKSRLDSILLKYHYGQTLSYSEVMLFAVEIEEKAFFLEENFSKNDFFY